jgi:hypothetical protein
VKILVICTHLENVSARLLARGFKQLGHNVKTAGPWVSGMWIPDFSRIGVGLDWKPDLVILADHHIELDTRPTCPLVLFAEDKRDFAPGVYAVADKIQFDWEFWAYKADVKGRNNASHIKAAYDPTLHRPGPPLSERHILIASMGQTSNGREELIKAVQQYFPVATGYGDLSNYILTYQNSQIALCKSRIGEDIEQRVIEQMAMGCFVLSEPRDGFADYGIVPFRDIVIYHDACEAVEIIRDVLRYPAAAARIAANGIEAVKPHRWNSRARTILETLGVSS